MNMKNLYVRYFHLFSLSLLTLIPLFNGKSTFVGYLILKHPCIRTEEIEFNPNPTAFTAAYLKS